MLAPVDLEGAVYTYLTPRLTGATVATRLPSTLPSKFVRVTRAGGSGRNLVQSDVRLLVECFADNSTDAFTLARMAYAHLWAAADSFIVPGVWVTQVELTEPVNFPDDSIARARYQFLAQMTTSLTEA
jgi:hypothetical protein